MPWAELLRKVFAVDVLECPECQGRLRVTAYIAEEAVARRILEHLGLDATGPPVRKAVSAEELPGPPPEHDGVDPVYEE